MSNRKSPQQILKDEWVKTKKGHLGIKAIEMADKRVPEFIRQCPYIITAMESFAIQETIETNFHFTEWAFDKGYMHIGGGKWLSPAGYNVTTRQIYKQFKERESGNNSQI